MSRLTELAVSKRSVALLLAVALFIGGISAWGNLKQELLPDIELPIITVVASDPKVMRVHSSAICRALRSGFQASRPKP